MRIPCLKPQKYELLVSLGTAQNFIIRGKILTENHEKIMFPDFVPDHFRILLGCLGHAKPCFQMILASGKIVKLQIIKETQN